MKALVTAIITAFNEEDDIGRCIDSLLNQDFDDMEILVVDDGSSDKTPDIVESYVQSNPDKVRLIRLPSNLGLGNARNIAALNANGGILVFLDADMAFPRDFIRRLVSPISDGSCVATCYEYEVIANTDNLWVKVQGQDVRGFLNASSTWAIRAIRRDVFLQHGGYDARYGYFDDVSFHEKTGISSVVVRGLYVYHYNSSNVRQIFRKNYWIGLSLRARYSRNKVELIKILLKRLFDVSPIIGACLTVFGAFFIAAELMLLGSFMVVSFRMKVLKAGSLREKILLRVFYAPTYRWIKSLGIWLGFLRSLTGKKYVNVPLNSGLKYG
jgi:glycosyltransferase involved in cell wall biosynthesis